jgi:hypothetical protein
MEKEQAQESANWETKKSFMDSFNESMAEKQKLKLKTKLTFYRFMSTMVDS